jgi:TM2 domain-containing membrane protein YozV
MTEGPTEPYRPNLDKPSDPSSEPAGQAPPPPPPPPYGQPTAPYGQPTGQPGYPPPPVPGAPGVPYGVSPQAPYGIHPGTGIPYSDKSKIVAGLLQIFLPFGIGRFYIGDTKTGVLQLIVTLVTCGIGGLWGLIDGIIMLATDSKDVNGYMLRS